MGKDLDERFINGDIQIFNKHTKKDSTSLVIRKQLIKATMRVH